MWLFRVTNPRLGNNNTTYCENFAQFLGFCPWILSLQENNNLCTLGLTMGTRDNFLVIGPITSPPPPTPHFCGFVSRFGCLLVVFWLHRTCARKLVWSSFWTFNLTFMHLTNRYGMAMTMSYLDFFKVFFFFTMCPGKNMLKNSSQLVNF